jgi:hypothetical protein
VTIDNETQSNHYTGSGVGPYTFNFKVYLSSQLKVYKTLIASPFTQTELVYTTDYTFDAGSVGADTGSITLVASLSSSYYLDIWRNVDFTQIASFVTQKKFDAAAIEKAYDYARMVDLELKRGVDRSIKLAATDDPSTYPVTLPAATALANTVIGFNSTSQLTVFGIGNTSFVPLSNATPQALGSAAAGTSSLASRGDHVHPTTGLTLTSRSIATTAPLTGGGDLSEDRTLAVSNATTGAVGVVILATDGLTTANTAVQGSDTRLLSKYVFCCPMAVATTTVFPVIPCETGAVTMANTCIQTAPVGTALNATLQLVYLGNMAVQSNFATLSIAVNTTVLNTSFNSVATNTSLGMTMTVTAIGNTTAGTNLTVKVK